MEEIDKQIKEEEKIPQYQLPVDGDMMGGSPPPQPKK
jgi:hypothetical protein